MIKEIDGIKYYLKSDGSLIPESQVKDIDKLRDQTVMEAADKLMTLKSSMIRLKAEVVDDINEFLAVSAEQYGVKLGGERGNLTLTSMDGAVRIDYKNSDTITFNEQIQVAKQLIDEYLDELTKDSNPELKTIVSAAFRLRQGRIDVKSVLKLREYNISDERWKKAMDIIDDAKQIVSTKKCLRLYVRNKLTGELENQPFDLSTL